MYSLYVKIHQNASVNRTRLDPLG